MDTAVLPVMMMASVAAGMPITIHPDWEMVGGPIHEDDLAGHIDGFFDAASVGGTITNWAGDDAISVEQFVPWVAKLMGVEHTFEYSNESTYYPRATDNTRRVSLAEQLAPLVRDLDPEEQSRMLYSIALQFHAAGSTVVALETLDGILQRDKKDAIHNAAALRKLQWASSAEVRHATRNGPRASANPMQFAGGAATDGKAQPVNMSDAGNAMEKILRGVAPAAKAKEWVQMNRAAARRDVATSADRMRIYERLRKTLPNGPWRHRATTELWLADPSPDPRKPIPANVRQIGLGR